PLGSGSVSTRRSRPEGRSRAPSRRKIYSCAPRLTIRVTNPRHGNIKAPEALILPGLRVWLRGGRFGWHESNPLQLPPRPVGIYGNGGTPVRRSHFSRWCITGLPAAKDIPSPRPLAGQCGDSG